MRSFTESPAGRRKAVRWLLAFVATSAVASAATALVTNLGLVAQHHEPRAEHCVQEELNAIENPFERFIEAFDCGDELFETRFNALDGVGANVGDGSRFTRVPRADLNGPGQWAAHFPRRDTGPNAEACNECHNTPFDDGAGVAVANIHRDPLHSADLSKFQSRNTPHLFAMGALQRLAEEMTAELQQRSELARRLSCRFFNLPIPVVLRTKGVDFGHIFVRCHGRDITRHLEGLDEDLVVKPFGWKGDRRTVRDFNRTASHNEMGMQPVETTGDDVDGDGDGVVNEMIIGDQTAMAIYIAAQPRPVSQLELAELGLLELESEQIVAIRRGERIFAAVGCADCHHPSLLVENPIFSEPSQEAEFRDNPFPAGQDPIARGVDPANPVAFDLTRDQPDNILDVDGGEVRLGAFERTRRGQAIVRLYGDLKRHDMGPDLAESIDEFGDGPATFITKELWGVGSTAPYLHDGRATTLTEAIIEHGGEAEASRDDFVALDTAEQADLIAFLNSLVLFKQEEEE